MALRRDLDEWMGVVFLVLLVTLSLTRGSPVFENIRSSGLASRTLFVFLVGLPVALVLTRGQGPRLFRLWVPFVVALMAYESMKHMHATALTHALGLRPLDPFLQAFDRMLFGQLAAEWFDGLLRGMGGVYAMLTALYGLYYFLPALLLARFYRPEYESEFRLLRRGVVLCLYGGYVMYIFIPVAGPPVFAEIRDDIPIRGLASYGYAMQHLRYQFDCFPSLHTALPWALTLLSWRYLGAALRLVLVVSSAGITLSTMALGFHYFGDVLGGLGWALVVHVAARWSLGDPVPGSRARHRAGLTAV